MLLRPRRFEKLKQQMKLNHLDILGVSETIWGDNGDFWSDDFPAKLLKNVGKDTEYKLFEMIKEMYRDDNILEHFAKSKIVVIPKKRNSTEFFLFYLFIELTHGRLKYRYMKSIN